MTTKKIVQILLIFLLLCCVGCRQQEPQPKPEGQKIKIGVSFASMEFDGNQTIKKYMEERKKKDKVDITFTDAKMDPSQQEKDVDQLIKKKVKAIILQTVSPVEGAALVDKITKAKIKVIALETLPVNVPMDGYIAADHIRAGELMAKHVLSWTEQQAAQKPLKVLILKGDPQDLLAEQIAGSAQRVLQSDKKIENVKIIEHPEGDPEMAQMTMQEVLNTEKTDVILATDDRLGNAAVKVLKARGMEKQAFIMGVGADRKASEALSSGEIAGEIDIQPELLASYAFDAAISVANNGNWNSETRIQNGNFDIPARIVPVRLIQKDQIYLLEERWGKLGQQQQQQEQQGSEQQGQSQNNDSSQESSNGSGGSSGEQGNQGGQGGQGSKTKVKITTQDGKVMEVEVEGEVKSIQAEGEGNGQQQGGEQSGQGGGE